MDQLTQWFSNTALPKLKSLHKSFTNWFNLGGVTALLVIMSNPEVEAIFSSQGLSIWLIIGNVFIRTFKTISAIEDKP